MTPLGHRTQRVMLATCGALLIVFAGVSRYAVHHLTKAK